MFEYKFVQIKKKNTGFLQVLAEDYQEIIHTHAAELNGLKVEFGHKRIC